MLHPLFEKMIQGECIIDATGEEVFPGGYISKEEGIFIFNLIREYGISSVLEIGCAFGGSSLQIGFALSAKSEETKSKKPRHMILDPNQHSGYNDIGLLGLDRAGFTYEFRDEPSEIGLPRLLDSGETFDMVVCDGLHTFDHTLLDLFYAERLIDENGIIVVDDTRMPGVNRAVRSVLRYPHIRLIKGVPADPRRGSFVRRMLQHIQEWSYWPLRLVPERLADEILNGALVRPDSRIGLFSTMVALQKIGSDPRQGIWYKPF